MTASIVDTEMQTPRDLLPAFYKQYDLSEDGGKGSSYFRIEFTKKLFLYFPNFEARRKAILKHDIHHIATGYASTFKGETEIGAWEIASGCRHYWVAFFLDLSGVMTGLLFNPIGVYKAFVKGRRTRNLYENTFSDEQVLTMPLIVIREFMMLNNYPSSTKGGLPDLLIFLAVILVGLLYSVLSLTLLPFILIYTIYIMLTKKERSIA